MSREETSHCDADRSQPCGQVSLSSQLPPSPDTAAAAVWYSLLGAGAVTLQPLLLFSTTPTTLLTGNGAEPSRFGAKSRTLNQAQTLQMGCDTEPALTIRSRNHHHHELEDTGHHSPEYRTHTPNTEVHAPKHFPRAFLLNCNKLIRSLQDLYKNSQNL